MVHLHPRSLARCSCRLNLSLGIKPDWHHQQRNPEGSGTRGWEVLVVSQMVCISSLELF